MEVMNVRLGLALLAMLLAAILGFLVELMLTNFDFDKTWHLIFGPLIGVLAVATILLIGEALKVEERWG